MRSRRRWSRHPSRFFSGSSLARAHERRAHGPRALRSRPRVHPRSARWTTRGTSIRAGGRVRRVRGWGPLPSGVKTWWLRRSRSVRAGRRAPLQRGWCPGLQVPRLRLRPRRANSRSARRGRFVIARCIAVDSARERRSRPPMRVWSKSESVFGARSAKMRVARFAAIASRHASPRYVARRAVPAPSRRRPSARYRLSAADRL